MFKDPIFAITTILCVIIYTSMTGAEELIPVFIQTMLGYSVLDSSLALLRGAIMMGTPNAN